MSNESSVSGDPHLDQRASQTSGGSDEEAVLHFNLEAGTTEFYEDPYYYDYEFKDRKEDVRFYTDQYIDVKGWCLELGVGSGRIAAPAVQHGAQVVGLDLHQGMLAVAQERREQLPKGKRKNLRLLQGDMRSFDLGEQFDLISCPFNVLQHMYTNDDLERCLSCIRKHLSSDGIFVFDVLMPNFEYLSRPPFERFPGVLFEHPTWNATYRYSEQSAYDPVKQLNHVWLYYDRVDPQPDAEVNTHAPEHHRIQLSHRYFYPMEIESALNHAGFEILNRMGDFDGGPLGSGSESMIHFCHLKS